MGTVPKPVPKYAFRLLFTNQGAGCLWQRPQEPEQESVKKTGAVSHLVEASHGLLINSGDVGQTSKG